MKNEGFFAFYKGYPISGISYPLYIGLQFSIYESLKEKYSYFAGGIAGIIAQSFMYPGDTIKRHLQLNGVDNTKTKYKGLTECIKRIYKIYGYRGFYTGFGVNLLKAVPEATIQFAVYDNVTTFLRTR